MNDITQMKVRIGTGRIRCTDIKHPGLLTDDQIASIPVEKVYEWCKSGGWKQRDFKKWLKVMRVI